MNLKQFGGKVTKELTERYAQSPNWYKGKFRNLERTTIDVNLQTAPGLIYKQLFKGQGRMPEQDLPILPFDKEAFLAPADRVKFIWYGHAVVLLRIHGLTVFIDPMMGPNAAPVAPFPVKRFSKNTLDILDELPPIDILLLTHDHYDHLDYASFQKLIPKTKQYFVALGAGRHLEAWGIAPEQITEFDWWDNQQTAGLEITYTPTRHASGRGIKDQSQCLWGGWVLKTDKESIYFSGDGGYGKHFKEIGERLGPFDFGFMECGQYNKLWRHIHMHPEESVQAALDTRVKLAMPFHWAGFALAQHHWKEPIECFTAEAQKQLLDYVTPRIGELVELNSLTANKPWWVAYQ